MTRAQKPIILNDVLSTLAKIPFLAKVPESILEGLAQKAKAANYAKNSTIIREGDSSNSLYIIISGQVRVYTSYEEGKEVTLTMQNAGSYFGELSLLTDEPRSATVATVKKTACAIIGKADFMTWLNDNPQVAISLLRVLSEKVRYLTERVKQMALSNVYERTIKVLMGMAVPHNGHHLICDRPTQQELASMVGASREMINKVLKELTKSGHIEIKDRELKIMKKLPDHW